MKNIMIMAADKETHLAHNSDRHRAVEQATKHLNPLDPVKESFTTFILTRTDSQLEPKTIKLVSKSKSAIDPSIIKWSLHLAEHNVRHFYEESPMGWQPKVKQTALNKNWAKYLIAIDESNKCIGYSMFRFDIDYGFSVLYCYEIHIEKQYQRKGLGTFFMSALEAIAKHWQMEKIVLTVLQNNKISMHFFNELGFVIDESSPDKWENAGYDILSKKTFSYG